MKINALPKFFLSVGAGVCSVAVAWAADGTPAAKSASGSNVPANPFGPKPSMPAEATAASRAPTEIPAMETPAREPARSEAFVPAVRKMLLERFDKNKDGKLDAAELGEARMILAGDKGRAAVTPAEVAQAESGPLFGLRPLIMRNFGKQNNETLTTEELTQLHTFLFGVKKEAPKAAVDTEKLRQDILQQFDKNGDGKLDDAELAAAKTALQQMFTEWGKAVGEKSATAKRSVPAPDKAAGSPPPKN